MKEIGRKAQEEDDKKEASDDDDDDNVDVKVSEKDINKLDLTDKQEEYLEREKRFSTCKTSGIIKGRNQIIENRS